VPVDIQAFVEAGRGRLPGLLGIEIDQIEEAHVRMRLPLRPELLAPNSCSRRTAICTPERSSGSPTRPAAMAASRRCPTARPASPRSS
jgi:hypothetical protein